MANVKKRVYWDACAWIALIQDETVILPDGSIERRGQMCRSIIESAKGGKVEILTSAFALAEVSKGSPNSEINTLEKLADFFENDYFLIVELDRNTGEAARRLMQSGFAGLKPPDATHLASACVAEADCLHTFDAKLINLDGKIDKPSGTKLKVSKPELESVPLPLLDGKPYHAEEQQAIVSENGLSDEELEFLNADLIAPNGDEAGAMTAPSSNIEAETNIEDREKPCVEQQPTDSA